MFRSRGSLAKSGSNNPMFGRKGKANPCYGKPLTEEHKKRISDSLKGKRSGKNNPFYGKHHTKIAKKKISKAFSGENHPLYGVHPSEKTLLKMSKAKRGRKHNKWKGGKSRYWHNLAWRKFGKQYCELCGITAKEYKKIHFRRMEMHNCLEPKDYTCMKPYAWQCVCRTCHEMLEYD